MLGWLETIACWLGSIGLAVAWALVEVLNVILAAFRGLLAALLLALPPMPPVPQFDSGVMGWIAWALPLAELVAGLASVAALFAAVLLVRVVLRWVRAL